MFIRSNIVKYWRCRCNYSDILRYCYGCHNAGQAPGTSTTVQDALWFGTGWYGLSFTPETFALQSFSGWGGLGAASTGIPRANMTHRGMTQRLGTPPAPGSTASPSLRLVIRFSNGDEMVANGFAAPGPGIYNHVNSPQLSSPSADYPVRVVKEGRFLSSTDIRR